MRCLSSGSSSARASMPRPAADRPRRCARLSPVSMTVADAGCLQRREARRRVRPRLVAHGDAARRPSPSTTSTETVLPSSFSAVDRGAAARPRRRALGGRLRRAEEHALAADAALDALAARWPWRRRPAAPAPCRPWRGRGSRRPADGWSPFSSAAASDSTCASVAADGDDVGDHGLPAVSVPVLSKATAVILPQRLEHRAALHQQAAARAGRQAGGDGGRRRDHQRAGAADQQDRQALVDPFVPVAAEEQRRHDGDQRADRRARRACRPREKRSMKRSVGAFDLLRLLDQPHDAGDRVVGGGGRDPHAQHAVAVDRAGEDRVADALALRHALARHRRLVDLARRPRRSRRRPGCGRRDARG